MKNNAIQAHKGGYAQQKVSRNVEWTRRRGWLGGKRCPQRCCRARDFIAAIVGKLRPIIGMSIAGLWHTFRIVKQPRGLVPRLVPEPVAEFSNSLTIRKAK